MIRPITSMVLKIAIFNPGSGHILHSRPAFANPGWQSAHKIPWKPSAHCPIGSVLLPPRQDSGLRHSVNISEVEFDRQ